MKGLGATITIIIILLIIGGVVAYFILRKKSGSTQVSGAQLPASAIPQSQIVPVQPGQHKEFDVSKFKIGQLICSNGQQPYYWLNPPANDSYLPPNGDACGGIFRGILNKSADESYGIIDTQVDGNRYFVVKGNSGFYQIQNG